MSVLAIRAALETALDAALSIALAWENTPYTPVTGTPYGRVHLLTAQPQALEMSQHLHREAGFMQVTLCYPLGAGSNAAMTTAEAIRTAFPSASEFTASGVTVVIDGLPEIGPADVEDDRYCLPVRVRFYAHIRRS
jgi:hypothetical protein